jgi:hypothetical protein
LRIRLDTPVALLAETLTEGAFHRTIALRAEAEQLAKAVTLEGATISDGGKPNGDN